MLARPFIFPTGPFPGFIPLWQNGDPPVFLFQETDGDLGLAQAVHFYWNAKKVSLEISGSGNSYSYEDEEYVATPYTFELSYTQFAISESADIYDPAPTEDETLMHPPDTRIRDGVTPQSWVGISALFHLSGITCSVWFSLGKLYRVTTEAGERYAVAYSITVSATETISPFREILRAGNHLVYFYQTAMDGIPVSLPVGLEHALSTDPFCGTFFLSGGWDMEGTPPSSGPVDFSLSFQLEYWAYE
jgi:hypothetical protein